MNASKGLSYELLGIVVMDGAQKESVRGLPVVAQGKDLIEYCKGASLDEVIIAADDPQKKEILEMMDILSQMGITIHCRIPVPELSGAHQGADTVRTFFDTVTYANRFVPVGQLLLKRLLDILGGLAGCDFGGFDGNGRAADQN